MTLKGRPDRRGRWGDLATASRRLPPLAYDMWEPELEVEVPPSSSLRLPAPTPSKLDLTNRRGTARRTGIRTAGASPACCNEGSHLAAFHESCAGRREAIGEALTVARAGGANEHRNFDHLERRGPLYGRRQNRRRRYGPVADRARRCLRTHARTYVLCRDLGDLRTAPDCSQSPGPHREERSFAIR